MRRHCSRRNLFIFILGCCCTVGFYLGESIVNFPTYFLDSIYEDNLETAYVNLPKNADTFLKWCHYFSVQLILLDKSLLLCLFNETGCKQIKSSDLIVFGVFEENLPNIHTMSKQLTKTKWIVKPYDRHHLFENSLTRIALLVIGNKEKYWHISKMPPANISDFAILQPKNLSEIYLNRVVKILLPTPLNRTFRHLENSRFIRCNETNARYIKKHNPYLYKTPSLINDQHLQDMAYMRDILLDIDVYPFLFGGTALGWYRECGIIPYTTDLDMAAFAYEYNSNLEKILKKDKRLKLYWILGMPNDSLEISVYSGKMKIDLFMVYENKTNSWVGGMIVPKKEKLEWVYPKIKDLCAADLNGHLFNVPCNVVQLLNADYGETWYRPRHESQFLWHSSHMNVVRKGKWTTKEWPFVFKTFDSSLNYVKVIR